MCIHVGLLPPLLDILVMGESHSWSWIWWTWFLKNKLSWTPFLPTVVPCGTLTSRFLNRAKSALLKSKDVILLFVFFPFLWILNSDTSLSMGPRPFLTFPCPRRTLLFVGIMFRRQPTLFPTLMTCLRKLSSALSTNFLGCLWLAVLPYQEISG